MPLEANATGKPVVARAALALGFAAIAFDQRGHGESDGPMDGRALDDVASIAALLRARIGDPAVPITLPGGHHRSIQHDEELQAVSLRWLQRSLVSGG